MENENKKGRKKKEIGYNSDFARQLRKLMEKNNTTQPQLAEAVGVSRQAVGQWQNGNTVPDILDFQKIADYYNVSADYLLGRAENSLKESEAKDLHFYKKLSDEAVENLETIFGTVIHAPMVDGIVTCLPIAETCNTFLSSSLFIDVIKILAELNAYSQWQMRYCGFSLIKSELTCKALNISRITLNELIRLIDNDLNNADFIEKTEDKDEICRMRICFARESDNECDLSRYRVLSLAEKINDIFDKRIVITDTIEEKERFLNVINITESEVRRIDRKMCEIMSTISEMELEHMEEAKREFSESR